MKLEEFTCRCGSTDFTKENVNTFYCSRCFYHYFDKKSRKLIAKSKNLKIINTLNQPYQKLKIWANV